MKRFWTDVTVTSDRGIALDARPVRTPGRAPLIAPTNALAEAIAQEWRDVDDMVDPRAMPLTGLANAAIDRIAVDPNAFADGLAAYAGSDLLCYRAVEPEPLIERQAAAWNPLLEAAMRRWDVHFVVTDGVMPVAQPDATLARMRDVVRALDAWRLAALSPLTTLSGSLLIALAVLDGSVTPEAGWSAATLDEDWQTECWGEDSLAAAARAERRRAYDAAVAFGRALAG